MGSILLWILKIAGILLLSVLAVLLLLLILVLAVPIRYRIQASVHQRFLAEGRIFWLFRFLSLSAVYDGELSYSVRLLGFQILSSETETGSEEEMEKEQMREPDVMSERETPVFEQSTPVHEPPDLQAEAQERQREVLEKQVKRSEPEREPREYRRGRKLFTFFQRMGKKVRGASETWQKLLDFWAHEENQRTIRLVLGQGKRLLLHLLPTDVSADVILGFEDPARTGQVLSYLSIPQAFYGDRIRITPVFDREIKEGDVTVKGRIRGGCGEGR